MYIKNIRVNGKVILKASFIYFINKKTFIQKKVNQKSTKFLIWFVFFFISFTKPQ